MRIPLRLLGRRIVLCALCAVLAAAAFPAAAGAADAAGSGEPEHKYVVVSTNPMSVGEVLQRLGESGKGAWITAADDETPLPDEVYACTGMVFHHADPSKPTLLIVIKGDVLGIGKVNLSQLVAMTKAVQGKRPLEGAFLRAGDMNNNGKLDLSDLVQLVKEITGR